MYQAMLRLLQLFFMLLSVAGIFAGIFMMGNGFKGDPINTSLGTQGFLLMLGALVIFPSRQHVLYRLWKARRSGLGSPSAPPAAKTQVPAKRVVVARPAAVIADPLGRNPKLYARRVRLDFPVPPPDLARATSWIGGLPWLPEDTKWPQDRGNPFLFVAQVAMADLPADLWGGHAPKAGSLAFFVDNDSDFRKVAVLHVDGPTTERAYPGPLMGITAYPILRRSLSGGLLAIPPDPNAVPLTKWAVRITSADGDTDLPQPYFKYRDPDNVATIQRKALSLSDPAFVPYSWETLLALITTLVIELNGSVQDERRKGLISDLHLESQSDRTAAAKILMALRDSLRKRARTTTFSAADWDKVVASLSETHVRQMKWLRKNPETQKAEYELLPPAPVLNILPLEKHYSAFEYLSRQVYAANPDHLPPPVRAALEPIWRHDAAFEVAAMGGQLDVAGYVTAVRSDLVCLLEVPRSELIGTSWHDLSSFGVFIAPEDLVQGRFDRAIGEVTES
jgi:hypothetical protein